VQLGGRKGNEGRTGLKGYAASLTPRIADVSEMEPDASEMLGLQKFAVFLIFLDPRPLLC
jgi:hypothetical protein